VNALFPEVAGAGQSGRISPFGSVQLLAFLLRLYFRNRASTFNAQLAHKFQKMLTLFACWSIAYVMMRVEYRALVLDS
jgi:hypothetical protein